MKSYSVAGITRIRNESKIIQETLDHFSVYCNAGIYVYDDCSEDNTVDICKSHWNVRGVISSGVWDADREQAEWQNRQAVFQYARKKASKHIDWFIYFDADERMFFDMDSRILDSSDAISMALFDFYITEQDKDRKYFGDLVSLRQKCGPEFRSIVMMFRNIDGVRWHLPDQREPTLPTGSIVAHAGQVRHYGKAISVDHWEDTCRYYSEHFPKYSEKWEKRKGKAVHVVSDFGRELVRWKDLQKRAIPLES